MHKLYVMACVQRFLSRKATAWIEGKRWAYSHIGGNVYNKRLVENAEVIYHTRVVRTLLYLYVYLYLRRFIKRYGNGWGYTIAAKVKRIAFILYAGEPAVLRVDNTIPY